MISAKELIKNLPSFFKLNEGENENGTKNIFLTIFFVYILIIVLKLSMFYMSYGSFEPIIMFNGEYVPMLHADAGLYGYYAKNILNGMNYPLTSEYMPGYVLAWLSNKTPFSLNEVLFYSPIFLSALVTIPIILLGYLIKLPKLAIYALLLGVFAPIYYIRNQWGYYDTDSLNMFFILMVMVFMTFSTKRNNIAYMIVAILSILAFEYWYHSYKSIAFFSVGVYSLYVLLFSKKILDYQLILPLVFTILPLELWTRVTLIFTLLLIIFLQNKYYKVSSDTYLKYLKYIIGLFVIGIFVYLFFEPTYYKRVLDYLNQDTNLIFNQASGNQLYFSGELIDVAESQGKGFNTIARHFLPGSYFSFILAFAGLIILCIQFRYLLIFASLAVSIFVAMQAGVRFGIFSIFALSIGISYWICKIEDFIRDKNYKLNLITPIIFLPIIYYFMYSTSGTYRKVALNKDDIHILEKVNKGAKNEDFMLSSWTYGWYLWYFTKFHTIIDNGKHFHDKYIFAKLLFSNPEYTALASRYFLEKCPNRSCKIAKSIFKDKSLQKVDAEIREQKSKKTKDIYFFISERMLLTANRMIMDLQIDKKNKVLGNGKYFARKIFSLGKTIIADDFHIDQVKKHIVILDSNKRVKFNTLFVIDSIKEARSLKGHKNASFYAIVYREKTLLVLHKDIFNSFFIQGFIFRNLDEKLFDIQYVTPTSSIIKVKN